MYWQKRMDQGDPDAELKEEMLMIREENKNYGYRRICGELKNRGRVVNKKKVQRLMQELHLQVTSFTHRSRRYSSYKGKVGNNCTEQAPEKISNLDSSSKSHDGYDGV